MERISKENAERILQSIVDKLGCIQTVGDLKTTPLFDAIKEGRVSLENDSIKYTLRSPVTFGGQEVKTVTVSDPLFTVVDGAGVNVLDMVAGRDMAKKVSVYCNIPVEYVQAMRTRDVTFIATFIVPLFMI